MAGRDITESLPLNIGNPGATNFWTNTAEAYDVAVGGMPFFLAPTDGNPYQRETAPYRKDQLDTAKEVGEQSLTGWWLRSQSSFHCGTGITYYDPTAGESIDFRFKDSQGVNVFNKGEVTLLKTATDGAHQITTAVGNKAEQHLRSIQWTASSNTYNGVLLHDGYDVDKIFPTITATVINKSLTSNVATLTTSAAHGLSVGMEIIVVGVDPVPVPPASPPPPVFDGTFTITAVTSTTLSYAKVTANVTSTACTGTVTSNIAHFVDYNSGTSEAVYAICDDGKNAYWVTNINAGGANKIHMFKKPLNGDTTTGVSYPAVTGDVTLMFNSTGTVLTSAELEFVKDRIFACFNNSVYEIAPNATSLPTALYTNPNTNYIYTSIAASGPAIYTAGHSGIYSTIQKYTLNTNGTVPTLTQAVVAAEFPPGEIVHKIYYYLGYMVIGTSRGVRVATVNDQDGSLAYGPLIFESSQPVYDIAARDRFIWCASGIGSVDGGLVRIDLGQTIENEPLRFAYANDLQIAQTTVHRTTAVAFIGVTDRLAFCTAYNGTDGAIYIEHATELVTSGYLRTGAIRFGTLEPKNFKFIRARADVTNGAIDIETIDTNNDSYNIITYNASVGTPEAATTSPEIPQEYLSYEFTLSRSASNASLGPTLKGYQVKALPATERQRLIQFIVWCFDEETDRFGLRTGYEGRAWERIQQIENIEKAGDIINVQDFTTGERVQALIEKTNFVRRTPPSGDFDGFGGILTITVRTVS